MAPTKRKSKSKGPAKSNVAAVGHVARELRILLQQLRQVQVNVHEFIPGSVTELMLEDAHAKMFLAQQLLSSVQDGMKLAIARQRTIDSPGGQPVVASAVPTESEHLTNPNT